MGRPDLDLETVVIADRVTGTTEITGWRIGHVSTKYGAPSQGYQRPKQRWGENTVFKTPSGMYVLVRQAFSLVYHTEPTICRTANKLPRGEVVRVTRMAEELRLLGLELSDAVSCDVCKPPWPEDLDVAPEVQAEMTVRYETPRRSIDRCPEGPPQVVRRVTVSRKFSGVTSTDLPEPARVLIGQCAANDPDWALADMPMERIS
jgi:hypothetical protein